MNTEWIYLALFGLMLVFCCYPMMRMMMHGSDKEERPQDGEQPTEKRTSAEMTDAQEALKS